MAQFIQRLLEFLGLAAPSLHDGYPAEDRAPAPASTPAATAADDRRQPDVDDVPGALPADTGLTPIGGVGNLDREDQLTIILEGPAEELMWTLSRRIEEGKLVLPQLPTTSLDLVNLSSRPDVDISELTDRIANDPVLSSEILRAANSAYYAGAEPIVTVRGSIVRVGTRQVRSLVLGATMRGVLLKTHGLADYGREVWRQSSSVAHIARSIAEAVGFDPERAYLIGLLQDIGKIALLALLESEMRATERRNRKLKGTAGAEKKSPFVDAALVGQVFAEFHERAGEAMAKLWKLPKEVTSVAGRHHDFAGNSAFPREAALAWLSHRIDLQLSLADEEHFEQLVASEAFEVLGTAEPARARALELGRAAYLQARSESASEDPAAVVEAT